MTSEEIIATVAAQRKRLSELSVREVALFGSYARNEAREDSDLDFLVEFDVKSFDHYMELKELLESLFDRPVDLVLKGSIKPRLRDRILREAIRAA